MIDVKGLTSQEAAKRAAEGLSNKTEKSITKSYFQILKDNLLNLFVLFNVIIAIALLAISQYKNLLFILIIAINSAVGIVQEIHAKRLVEKLSILGASKSTVLRDGEESVIFSEDIVQDDVIILKTGDQIPADGVIIGGEIGVNESLLTGESDPVTKTADLELFAGSFVVSGKAYARVTKVGSENFASKIASQAKKYKKTASELMGSMKFVTKITAFFIPPIGAIMLLQALLLRSESVSDSIVGTSAALLGMLPKGLVLLISISLITGILKLSRKRILIQQMYALENLAHVDTLCLDKTGTITENTMIVEQLIDAGADFDDVLGSLLSVLPDSSPTFDAIRKHFPANEKFKAEQVIHFSSEKMYSGAKLDGVGTVLIGAPERLLTGAELPTEVNTLRENGNRIICVTVDDVPVGFIALSDVIRENAEQTIAYFKEQGVDVKIISGDSPVTVSFIAKRAGVDGYDKYIDMSTVAEEDIPEICEKYSIFGRVSPYQKQSLVKALQGRGRSVAMTGDGVNDVLALREADCSIAMSCGSDAARQVSHLVLLDNDFRYITDAVAEGRRVVHNITRFGGVFFIKTLYSVIVSLVCIITNTPFPFAPIAITFYDGVIEGFASFVLSFEPVGGKPKHGFLKEVFTRAFPFAFGILLCFIIGVIASRGASADVIYTALFYGIGGAGIFAVICACLPWYGGKAPGRFWGTLRVLLCIAVPIGFYGVLAVESFLATHHDFHVFSLVPINTEIAVLSALFTLLIGASAYFVTKLLRKITGKK